MESGLGTHRPRAPTHHSPTLRGEIFASRGPPPLPPKISSRSRLILPQPGHPTHFFLVIGGHHPLATSVPTSASKLPAASCLSLYLTNPS